MRQSTGFWKNFIFSCSTDELVVDVPVVQVLLAKFIDSSSPYGGYGGGDGVFGGFSAFFALLRIVPELSAIFRSPRWRRVLCHRGLPCTISQDSVDKATVPQWPRLKQQQQQYNLGRLRFNRRGGSTPLWGVEACSHPSRRPNPIPAIPPYVVRTPHLHGAPTTEETVKL